MSVPGVAGCPADAGCVSDKDAVISAAAVSGILYVNTTALVIRSYQNVTQRKEKVKVSNMKPSIIRRRQLGCFTIWARASG
jgi:hypothetical protein